ncbi:hypothetical protein B7P43_G17418 [Cryptotermes secundus]|uniref:Mos1 transposase HTH domain-containing protein n=1 Tax=Cryptotermes secundus TaxID=105785 RepID=A0A2J7PBC5_9NEOP|nr:hypothetical protein B7P43_G17418 [Cryptotermes secundus]
MEQCIVIKFLVEENVPPDEIHHRLQQQYGEECPSWTRVFEWCKCFREGRECVENEPHDRRPRTSITKPNIDRADALIRENRRNTIKELGAMLSISVGSVEDIMKYHLHYRKVNAQWVPRTLTDVNKMVRMQVATKTRMETLRKLKWNLLTHPPYSPDLAPSDFYLFGRLKSDLQGMQFVDDDAVIQNVREWIHHQPQNFFEKGTRMLPERWKKCVDCRGEYVED